MYTAAMMHREARDLNTPKKIAAEIEQIIPSDLKTLYEVGSSRRLEDITCNLKRNIMQADTFRDLEEIRVRGKPVYFMYDRGIFNASGEAGKWDNIYARKSKHVQGEELLVSRTRPVDTHPADS